MKAKNMTKEQVLQHFIEEFCLYEDAFYSETPKQKEEREEKIQKLQVLLDCFYDEENTFVMPLDERQTDIFRKAYGILSDGNCASLSSIAKLYNLSSSYVKSVLDNSESKLHKYVRTKTEKIEYPDEMLNNSILVLHLPSRIFNNLLLHNIYKIGDLVQISQDEMCTYVGKNACKQIEENLHAFGLHLKSARALDFDQIAALPYEVKLNLTFEEIGCKDALKLPLKRSKIYRISDLMKFSSLELQQLYGMGPIRYQELAFLLERIGLNVEQIVKPLYRDNEEKLQALYGEKDTLAKRKELLLSQLQNLETKMVSIDSEILAITNENVDFSSQPRKK